MVRSDILRRAWDEIEPEVVAKGFELVEVEIAQQGAMPILRLYVDREGGVTLDHCAELSRSLSPFLDVIGFMDGRYALEVSSPGIDRPVRKPKDFEQYIGEAVKVKTITPLEGRKKFRGTLAGFADGMITLENDGRSVQIHLENIHKAQLDR